MNHPQATFGRARLPPSQLPGRDGVPTYRGVLLLCLILAQGLLSPTAVSAQETTEQAVQSGREALNGRRNYPWYDRQKDAVRRIELEQQPDQQPEKKIVAAKIILTRNAIQTSGLCGNKKGIETKKEKMTSSTMVEDIFSALLATS